VEIDFFEKIVDFAKEHDLIVIHDFAYGDIVFDGYKAPSFLQVPGAKDVGIEFFTLSKSYNMPGWRVGFAVGNSEIINALARIKSYQDYGMFQPIQIAATVALNGPRDCVEEIIAATVALNGPRDCVEEITETYRSRRNVLCESLNRMGWKVTPPKATMMVWAEIPDQFKDMGSLEFSKMLLEKAKVAVAPGIGFGEGGDHFVRFSLVENEHRIRQAVRGIREVF